MENARSGYAKTSLVDKANNAGLNGDSHCPVELINDGVGIGKAIDYLKEHITHKVTRKAWHDDVDYIHVSLKPVDLHDKITEPWLALTKEGPHGVTVLPLGLGHDSILAEDWILL